MAKISDPWDHHDWASRDYVLEWAERQDATKPHREPAFGVIAVTIPFKKDARIKILDIGSGYGALTHYLLSQFGNGQAVCHDGSAEMLELGRQLLAKFKGRVKFIQSDLSKPGCSKKFCSAETRRLLSESRPNATVGERATRLVARSRLPGSPTVLGGRQARDRRRIQTVAVEPTIQRGAEFAFTINSSVKYFSVPVALSAPETILAA